MSDCCSPGVERRFAFITRVSSVVASLRLLFHEVSSVHSRIAPPPPRRSELDTHNGPLTSMISKVDSHLFLTGLHLRRRGTAPPCCDLECLLRSVGKLARRRQLKHRVVPDAAVTFQALPLSALATSTNARLGIPELMRTQPLNAFWPHPCTDSSCAQAANCPHGRTNAVPGFSMSRIARRSPPALRTSAPINQLALSAVSPLIHCRTEHAEDTAKCSFSAPDWLLILEVAGERLDAVCQLVANDIE